MPATHAQIRAEVVAALAAVAGNATAVMSPNPTFPLHLVARAGSVLHNQDGAGHRRYQITVTTYLPVNDSEDAQDDQDALVTAVADALNTHTDELVTLWAPETTNFRPETIGTTKTIAFDTLVEALG